MSPKSLQKLSQEHKKDLVLAYRTWVGHTLSPSDAFEEKVFADIHDQAQSFSKEFREDLRRLFNGQLPAAITSLTEEEFDAIMKMILKDQQKYYRDKAKRGPNYLNIKRYETRSRSLTQFRVTALLAGVAKEMPRAEQRKLAQLFLNTPIPLKALACPLLSLKELKDQVSTASMKPQVAAKYFMFFPPWWSLECVKLVKKLDELTYERYPKLKIGEVSMLGGCKAFVMPVRAPSDTISAFKGREEIIQAVRWAFVDEEGEASSGDNIVGAQHDSKTV